MTYSDACALHAGIT